MLSSVGLYGQITCDNFSVTVNGSATCDDNGTPNDLTDDTYTVDVTILSPDNPFAPFGAEWSSDSPVNPSGKFIDGPVFTFGPFLIANGDQTITITDPLGPCSETITLVAPDFCSTLPAGCPEVNVSATYLSDEGCCVTYMVVIDGVDPSATSFGMNVSFNVSGATVDNFDWLVNGNPLDNAGITTSSASTTASLLGLEIPVDFFGFDGKEELLLTICGEPGECMTLTRAQGGRVFSDGQICSLAGASPTQEFCVEGNQVDGLVYMLDGGSSCPGGVYIENAEVSISNATDGELCTSLTDSDGLYSCEVCEDGPYEICVETTCKEPCGLEQVDIAWLTNCILLFVQDCPEGTQFTGDVNGDGFVRGSDVVAMREMLLYGQTSQGIESWCRFVPVPDWQMVQAGFLTPDEVDNCYEVPNANTSVDFIQFNLGDINGSCNECDHGNGGSRIAGANTNLLATWSDKIYRLHADEVNAVRLYSLQVELPIGSKVDYVRGVSEDMSYNIENNLLSVVWNRSDLSAVELDVQSTLLEIGFDEAVTHQPSLVEDSNGVFLFSNDTYFSDINSTLDDRVYDGRSTNNLVVELNQSAVASFSLPTAESIVVTIYDIAGNQVYGQTHNVGGKSSVDIRDRSLNTGIYLVSVATGSTVTTEKIFVAQ